MTSRGLLILVALSTACVGRPPDPPEGESAESVTASFFYPSAISPLVSSGGALEVGMKLTADTTGVVHKIYFYKPSASSGSHTGHIWDASGNLLANSPFVNETASGWQETPVSVQILTGQTYIVSYSISTGSFPYTTHVFDAPVDRAPLHAPAGAGMYAAINTMPVTVFQNSTYYVDVGFDAAACVPTCSTCGAADGCGGTCCAAARTSIWAATDGPTGGPNLSTTDYELGVKVVPSVDGLVRALRYYKDPAIGGTHVGHLWSGAGALLASATFAPGTASGWQEAPLSAPVAISAGQTYVASVRSSTGSAFTQGGLAAGRTNLPLTVPANGGVYAAGGVYPTQVYAGSNYWVDLVFSPVQPGLHIFPASAAPAYPLYGAGTQYELGVKFTSDVAGSVTQLRFYKGAGGSGTHVGHLWSATGALLATATFTGETASGWQQVVLPTPVAVAAGTTYVASFSSSTGYGWTQTFFPFDNAPLHVATSGGVYAVGTGFPTQTYASSNYWVDVTLVPALPTCVPQCTGLTCGASDGCGGSCCSGSGCVLPACDRQCGLETGCGDVCQPITTGVCATPLPAARPFGTNLPFVLMNYFDGPAAVAKAQADLAGAAARGFTFARIIGHRYWAAQMSDASGWFTNPTAYFAQFDALMHDARQRGIRLVPSLLFNSFTFPDLMHQPRGQLFVPGSPTRLKAEQYITEVVTRYRNDDTILFWEVSNELNLLGDVDITCSDANCPDAAQTGGGAPTPTFRTAADNFALCNPCMGGTPTQEDLGQFLGDMQVLIHGLDPHHLVSSGNGEMRANAYHLARPNVPNGFRTWADTPKQAKEILLYVNPTDVLSIHPYPGGYSAVFGDPDLSGAPVISSTQIIATLAGKPLYVGEYGEPGGGTDLCHGTPCGGDASKLSTRRVADTIVASNVAWSSFWAYDSTAPQTCGFNSGCYSVPDADPVMPLLAMRQQQAGTCVGKLDGTACPFGTCGGQGICMPPITPARAVTKLQEWTFTSAASVTGWGAHTTCTGCTPGTFLFVGADIASAKTFDLPCSGCGTPGLTVVSPSVTLPGQAGWLTLRSGGSTTKDNVSIALLYFDANNVYLGGQVAAVDKGFASTSGVTFQIPATAARAQVELHVNEANATLGMQKISVTFQPL